MLKNNELRRHTAVQRASVKLKCHFRAAACLLLLAPPTALIAQDKPAAAPVEYGPCVCHSVTFVQPASIDSDTWEGATPRAINIALAGDTTICYDADRLAVAAVWRGGFLDTTNTHHTSYKGQLPPRPAAKPFYLELSQPGWSTLDGPLKQKKSSFGGYYLHGDRVALDYRVADRNVAESPTTSGVAIGRIIHIGGGFQAVSLLVGRLEGAAHKIDGHRATLAHNEQIFSAAMSGEIDGLKWRAHDGVLHVDIPAARNGRQFVVWFHQGDAAAEEAFRAATQEPRAAQRVAELGHGGPRRWTREITSTGTLGEATGAYTIDEIAVPEKPYGLWMRLSAIDFFADGRCAIATMCGDVWIVSWEGDDVGKATWQRFATGLYEPLGLKILQDQIYVRGRDRITWLKDKNDDGEADYYQQIHASGPVGPGYHAFVTDLVTDAEGNFYYAIGGRKSPSVGEVVKVYSDWRRHETIAEHFRCPNGMGCGGPHGWLTIADNPDGKFPSGGSIVVPGAHYGEEGGPRTAPFLYLLPPKVDTSSGSQGWAHKEGFGPLSGALIHTSYSTSSISYVLTQNSKPHPSGFAVHLPFGFKSGPMRLAVSPRDGQMYIASQRGWDTNAGIDGALSRLRFTGKEQCLVTAARATATGVELTFSQPLDAATVDYDNFSAARVSDKVNEEVEIDDVESLDERTVLVRFAAADIDPEQNIDRERTKRDTEGHTHYRAVPPLAITFNVKTKDGAAVKETVYCTINGVE